LIAEFQRRRSRGETSAEEEARACLAQIAARNASLGAFVEVAAESALASARASDERPRLLGELDGVPIAIKDNIDVAGMRAAAGIEALEARRPRGDAPCVQALRQRGAVLLGKTLMDEGALGASGDNAFFGRCHNPHRHGYSAGGSSSGSAAAVAAGLCAAALGTDTLGSVRIPASYCGIVGYVPSAGLIDARGVAPLAPSFDRVGMLARSIADAAALARAMDGSIQSTDAPQARIGVLPAIERALPAPLGEALEQALQTLARAGHRVVELDASGFDWRATRRAAFLLIEVEAARVHAPLLETAESRISAAFRAALEFGRSAGAQRIARASEQCRRSAEQLRGWLRQCDVLVLPSTPHAAFAFGLPAPEDQADFTAPSSLLGLPALSVPARVSMDGLPLGVQFVTDQGRDGLLLGVAACLE
jgi:Asp-tRNA(Asn)/Glu-tRNA(Gln) amidotransferase A subunit family amidase